MASARAVVGERTYVLLGADKTDGVLRQALRDGLRLDVRNKPELVGLGQNVTDLPLLQLHAVDLLDLFLRLGPGRRQGRAPRPPRRLGQPASAGARSPPPPVPSLGGRACRRRRHCAAAAPSRGPPVPVPPHDSHPSPLLRLKGRTQPCATSLDVRGAFTGYRRGSRGLVDKGSDLKSADQFEGRGL